MWELEEEGEKNLVNEKNVKENKEGRREEEAEQHLRKPKKCQQRGGGRGKKEGGGGERVGKYCIIFAVACIWVDSSQ